MRRFVSVDLETTGLDPAQDYIAEVGLVGEDYVTGHYFELAFSLAFPDGAMSAGAAAVNGWGRRDFAPEVDWQWAAGYLTSQLNDVHVVGKNPGFDTDFLHFFLKEAGLPGGHPWHHRMVDVGNLAWGYIACEYTKFDIGKSPWTQPPNVEEVEKMIGIKREIVHGSNEAEYHTALCDARWNYRVFRSIVPKED